MTLMNYKKAAAFLDMPLGTLYALVHQKRIPHLRLGNRMVRFDLEALHHWLEEHRMEPHPSDLDRR
jgi:excisionase family DNA binding protein